MVDDTIYLDFAATSAIRPPAVGRAVSSYLESIGATPGRAGHRLAIEAGRVALRCRHLLKELFNLPGDPGRITFGFNATHALNTALWGVLRSGDAVVVSAYDHNAVRRPVHALAQRRDIEIRELPGTSDGSVDLARAERLLDGARLLVVNGASNVLGTRMPCAELSDRAHHAGALVLMDAAQLAGHAPLDVEANGVDLLAFTGHKGLLGPQGTGGLWIRDGCDVRPLLTGGTGGDSMQRSMPDVYPDHLEAGTLNGPGIAGLAAGVEYLLERGVAELHRETARLKNRLRAGLEASAGVRVLSPPAPDGVPIVTFTADGLDPARLAGRLDREHGVMTRAGLHCAPDAHRLLGTTRTGAVRMSLGWCTTDSELDAALAAVDRVTLDVDEPIRT